MSVKFAEYGLVIRLVNGVTNESTWELSYMCVSFVTSYLKGRGS